MNPVESRLFETAATTLEQTCFLFLLPDAPEGEPPLDEVAMYVDYDGPFRGRLAVSTGPEQNRVIASSMLGVRDPGAIERADALGEVANIIGGNILPLLADQATFRMSSLGPCDPLDPGAGLAKPGHARVELFLEEGRVTVWLFWTPSIALNPEALT